MPVRLLFSMIFAVIAMLQPARAQTAPEEVTIGMFVNDVQLIDLPTNSYAMDVYLWFRWTNAEFDPASQFEFMNLFDPEGHVQTQIFDAPKPQPDGSLYQIIRHQGLFSHKFPIQTYPFDKQKLVLIVEDAEQGSAGLVYVPDTDVITVNPDIRLPGFRIGTASAKIAEKIYPTAFGDLAEPDATGYSRVTFEVPISRPVAAGILKTFVPVWLIMLAAVFALLLDPEHVEARIGLAITALLALVAMQFTMQGSLPEVAYLTLTDQIYLASYIYIISVIALIVRGTRTDERGLIRGKPGADSRAEHSGARLALMVTAVYATGVAGICALNLS